MARKDSVVSRTVSYTKGTFLTVDKEGNTNETVIIIPRTYRDNDAILKAARKYAADHEMNLPVFVKSANVITKRIAMYEGDFINSDKAFELPLLKIND